MQVLMQTAIHCSSDQQLIVVLHWQFLQRILFRVPHEAQGWWMNVHVFGFQSSARHAKLKAFLGDTNWVTLCIALQLLYARIARAAVFHTHLMNLIWLFCVVVVVTLQSSLLYHQHCDLFLSLCNSCLTALQQAKQFVNTSRKFFRRNASRSAKRLGLLLVFLRVLSLAHWSNWFSTTHRLSARCTKLWRSYHVRRRINRRRRDEIRRWLCIPLDHNSS